MELLYNLSLGKARTEFRGGREYLVAPCTSIVPGVLEGSQGPLYYPKREISRNVSDWDGMPITVYHPVKNGQPASASDPEVRANQQIGEIHNSTFRGKLQHEAWIDVKRAARIDNDLMPSHRILPRLKAGKAIEVSTGLYTDNHPAPEGANHNGKPYSFIAKNYRPDHLAILPDQLGACSINDGCGMLVNQRVQNAWSDAAREAAAASRRARSASKKTSFTPKAADTVGKASSHGPQEHSEAQRLHGSAASTHEMFATSLREKGDEAGAKLHDVAAKAHRDADDAHHEAREQYRKHTFGTNEAFMENDKRSVWTRIGEALGFLTRNGGPGSGPHKGHRSEHAESMSAKAHEASSKATSSKGHRDAQWAHEDAASAHRVAAEELGSRAARMTEDRSDEGKATVKDLQQQKEQHVAAYKAHEKQADVHAGKVTANAQPRHPKTGTYQGLTHVASKRGFEDTGDSSDFRGSPDADPDAGATLRGTPNAKDDDGRQNVKIVRRSVIDIDGDGDGAQGDDHDPSERDIQTRETRNGGPGSGREPGMGAKEKAPKDKNKFSVAAGDKSAYAHAASSQANKSGSFSEHKEAMREHRDAAEAHDFAAAKAGRDTDLGKAHLEAKEAHLGAMKEHQAYRNQFKTNQYQLTPNGGPMDEPHDASKQAASATLMTEHAGARDHALAAMDHSGEDNPKKASRFHIKAAEAHEGAATEARQDKDPMTADQHDNAAALHRKAASMHAACVTNSKTSKGNDMPAIELKGLTSNQRKEKLKELRPKMLAFLNNRCSCETEKKGYQMLNNETLATIVNAFPFKKKGAEEDDEDDDSSSDMRQNAKAEGSNADANASGSKQVGGDGNTEHTGSSDFRGDEMVNKKGPGQTSGKGIQNYLREHGTAQDREIWDSALAMNQQAKEQLINRLVANVRDKSLRKRLVANHMKKSIAQLKDEVAALPALPVHTHNGRVEAPRQEPRQELFDFSFAPTENDRVENAGLEGDDDILTIPTINYSDPLVKRADQQQTTQLINAS